MTLISNPDRNNVIPFPASCVELVLTPKLPRAFNIISPGMNRWNLRPTQRVNIWNKSDRYGQIKSLIGTATVKQIITTSYPKVLVHAASNCWAQNECFEGNTARAFVVEMIEETFGPGFAVNGTPMTVTYFTMV